MAKDRKTGWKMYSAWNSEKEIEDLYRASEKGWIREILSDEPGVERRRLYQLTEAGREALRAEIARLRRMLDNAEGV